MKKISEHIFYHSSLYISASDHQVTTPTLPSPFPAMKAAGSPTGGRVWEGVKNGISYTIKLEGYSFVIDISRQPTRGCPTVG